MASIDSVKLSEWIVNLHQNETNRMENDKVNTRYDFEIQFFFFLASRLPEFRLVEEYENSIRLSF